MSLNKISKYMIEKITAEDVDAIPISEKGVVGGVARLNEEGKVVDASGNEVEGKVKSVNGMIGDVVGLETVEGATQKANQAEVNAKAYTDQQIQLVTETGIPKLVRYEYTLYPTTENQTTFEIPLNTFDVETDSEVIVKNTVTLDPNEDYTIEGKNIVLNEPVPLNTRLTVFIYKNVPIGEEGAINGVVLANGTIAFEKLDEATKNLINNKANRDELIQLQNDLNNTKDLVYTKADNVNLISLEQTVNKHLADDVSQGEVHGLRVTDGKLEYFDGQEWQRVKGGSGYPVGNVSNFRAKAGDGEVTLTWEDPADVTITDNNGNIITIARWKGTKILRKTGSYPQNENDGVLVVDNGVRNQYAQNGFIDIGLTNGTTYYYMAFPYTEEDVYTVDEANRVEATPTEQRIYGVRIDKNNSNPETRVTYIGDAVGFTPMRGNNGNFSWGSWQEVFESFEIRPCVLKNKQVQYYLDPNDFTKKVDGSSANLTGDDGDVMIEFGKTLWWKWTDEGDTYTIEISDKEFDGAVKHAFEIEEGYNLVPYYPLLLTQILFVIFFKSTDSQTALGRGFLNNVSNYKSTGNTNNKGMFYGSENGEEQMKFLGIEDYWGNKFWWIDGLVTDNNYNLLIGKGNFNDNGNGYQSFSSGVSSNTDGYIDSVQGGNNKGFIIKSKNGSSTTYYADYGYLYSTRVAQFGGIKSYGGYWLYAGFAHLQLYNSSSQSKADIGARLFCSVGDKIYIGAYLGTTQNGKLRSISGTGNPTASKTIGTFRTEARANNS